VNDPQHLDVLLYYGVENDVVSDGEHSSALSNPVYAFTNFSVNSQPSTCLLESIDKPCRGGGAITGDVIVEFD
jgi:hypothetical protein